MEFQYSGASSLEAGSYREPDSHQVFKTFPSFQDFSVSEFQSFSSVQHQYKWRTNPDGALGASLAMIKSKSARFSQHVGATCLFGTPCVDAEGSEQISTISFSWVSLSLACSRDGSREQFLGVTVLRFFFDGSGD